MTDIALDEKALLPCPFCGSSEVVRGNSGPPNKSDISCFFCGAFVDAEGDDSAAASAWNRRSSPSQVAPANPAQGVSDRDALIEKYASACKRNAHEMAGMPVTIIMQHFREFADEIAAIGAGGQAVAVKPLRWPPECPRGQRVHGRGAPFEGAEYCIAHYGGSHGDDTVFRWAAPKDKWSEPFDNFEAAKAAAQADYERRILSALSQPHPADERVVEALRETADALETLLSADPDMPTYQSDYDVADQQLERARTVLSAKEGR